MADNNENDLGLDIVNGEIKNKDLKLYVELTTLDKALKKYESLKYTTEAKNNPLGIVQSDPDLGYVFYIVRYNNRYLR